MAEAPLIDEELAAFLQSGMSLHVASRGAGLEPRVARAVGCRVSPDRRLVTVFVLASQAGPLLGDFAANGDIAFVASYPSTHRTVQLKGRDARPVPLDPADESLVARQADAFVADLAKLGYEEALPRSLLAGECADVVAVAFTPLQAFAQTPGPGAGAPLAKPA